MLNSYAFTRHNLIGYNNCFKLLEENWFHVIASEFDSTISACIVFAFLPNFFLVYCLYDLLLNSEIHLCLYVPDCANTVKVFYFLNANLVVNLDADFFSLRVVCFVAGIKKQDLRGFLDKKMNSSCKGTFIWILILNFRKIPTPS